MATLVTAHSPAGRSALVEVGETVRAGMTSFARVSGLAACSARAVAFGIFTRGRAGDRHKCKAAISALGLQAWAYGPRIAWSAACRRPLDRGTSAGVCRRPLDHGTSAACPHEQTQRKTAATNNPGYRNLRKENWRQPREFRSTIEDVHDRGFAAMTHVR
jgi:hypothetical protein